MTHPEKARPVTDDVPRATRPGVGSADHRARLPSSRSIPSSVPWIAPQITKVQAAPCHRPPSSIVNERLT